MTLLGQFPSPAEGISQHSAGEGGEGEGQAKPVGEDGEEGETGVWGTWGSRTALTHSLPPWIRFPKQQD